MNGHHTEKTQLEGLVLRRKEYPASSSLLFWLLDPQLGKVPCWWKGGLRRRGKKKGYMPVDLLRVLCVSTYAKSSEGFYLVREVQVLEDYAAIAKSYPHFQATSAIVDLLWHNTHEGLDASVKYEMAKNILRRMKNWVESQETQPAPFVAITGAILVLCFEEGVLPAFSRLPQERAQNMRETIAAFLDASLPLPSFSTEQWRKIHTWVLKQAQQGHLVLPDGGPPPLLS
ncbi:MAG: hypothetical protein D6820_17580 [Lentisphaerae bacterium]|nr:MAG: hypothetical protein D6820_17580 [Lentisphaerota bacterium]